jgi:uncharacterized membrane protein YdjX (TVP38/TMEM64 family)
LSIPVLLYLPQFTPLVWFALLAVPANSPLSPITPVAFEPLIMEAAKHSGPLEVTLVGLGVYLYMEYLNWHLYRWVLDRRRLQALKQKRWIIRSVEYFARAPFVTTVVFAFTPLPFWVARVLAIYNTYPLARFMGATALGRLPRIFLYAWLGATLSLPSILLATAAIGATVIVVAWRVSKRSRILEDPVLDVDSNMPASAPASLAAAASDSPRA